MFKKYFLIIIIICFSIYPAISEVNIDKIGVINIDEVIKTVFSGNSAAIQEIKKEKEDFQKTLDKMKDNIMKLEALKLKETDANKKIAYDKKIEEAKKEYSDYYKVKNYQLETKIKNVQGPMLNEVKNVIKIIAEKDGYSLILDVKSENIFYYSIDIDITQKTIEYLTKKYKEN
jgi:Skp family chaperone for outer membrane proteins